MKLPELSRRNSAIAFGIVVAALIALRFLFLSGDPSDHFQHYGLGQLTDPNNYTALARNIVLFGEMDPFDYSRYHIFGLSLVSLMAWLLFSLFEVSRLTSNLAGLFLSVGGIALYSWSLIAHRDNDNSVARIVLLLLLTNALLFFFGRLPFLENGLIFLSALAVLLYFRCGHSLAGLFLTGTTIALAALMGKLFGVVLLAPVAVDIVMTKKRKSLLPLAAVGAGFGLGAVAFISLLEQISPGSFWRFINEVNELVGRPIGFVSFRAFVESLSSYLARPPFSHFSGSLIVTAAFGWLLLMLAGNNPELQRHKRQLLFALIWIAAGVLVLAPQTYRPIRYGLFLLLPCAQLAALCIVSLYRGNIRLSVPRSPFIWPGVIAGFTLLLASVYAFTLRSSFVETGLPKQMLLIIAIATVLTIVFWLLLSRQSMTIGRPLGIGLLTLTLLGIISQSGYLIGYALPRTYHEMSRISLDAGDIISPEAVLAGAFAPAITTDNNLKFVVGFKPLGNDPNFIDTYGITHLVVTSDLWKQIRDYYRLSDRADLLFSKWVRGTVINCYRITLAGYPRTPFDDMKDEYYSRNLVRAREIADHLDVLYPGNHLVLQKKLKIILAQGRIPEIIREFTRAMRNFPDSYDTQWICGLSLAKAYLASNNKTLLLPMRQCIQRMTELHPKSAPDEELLLNTAQEVLDRLGVKTIR